MSGNAVDSILQRLKKPRQDGGSAKGVMARFVVTKMSWRGSYRRIMVITRDAIVTCHPDTMSVTNVWMLDRDLLSVAPNGPNSQDAAGGVVVLQFKKKTGSKETRFACHERAGLLSAIYCAVYDRLPEGMTENVPFIPPSQMVQAYKLKKGEWKPVILRLTAVGVDRLDARGGRVRWRWKYQHAAEPGIRLLSSKAGVSGHQPLAFFSKTGRSPRVYAVKNREAFVKSVQSAANKSLGIEVTVDTSMDNVSASDMLQALMAVETEKASKPAERPIGEWDIWKVNLDKASGTADPAGTGSDREGQKKRVLTSRRIILTSQGLIERRTSTYEIVEWRLLPTIACIIRYADEPQWLGIEWADGAERCIYITPARDTLLTALLYASQAAAKRIIEVKPYPTGPGDPLIRLPKHPVGTPAIFPDAVSESICLHLLQDASLKFLAAKGDELSLGALVLAGLTASLSSPTENHPAEHSEGAHHIGSLEHVMTEFCASIPYTGVSKGTLVMAHFVNFMSTWRLEPQNQLSYFSDVLIDTHIVTSVLCYIPSLLIGSKQLVLTRDEERLVVLSLNVLQRMSTSAAVKAYMLGAGGACGKIYNALLSSSDHVSFEAGRLLLRLFNTEAVQTGNPAWMEDVEVIEDSEARLAALASSRTAKAVCFISDTRCASIVEPIKSRTLVSPLLASIVVEVIVSVACFPGAKTTDIATRETMIRHVAKLGRKLFSLFGHSNLPVSDGLARLMRTLAEGGSRAAEPMRRAAIEEGALLSHLILALEPNKGAHDERSVSRELVSLWCDSHLPSRDLLSRIFPMGLLSYLDKSKSRKTKKEQNMTRKKNEPSESDVIEKESHEIPEIYFAGKAQNSGLPFLQYNWDEFWRMVDKDHQHAALIWNEKTRTELRESLKVSVKCIGIANYDRTVTSFVLSCRWRRTF